MIRFILAIKIFIILLILFPHISYSSTLSSTYLIANAAIFSNDYDTAAKYLLDEISISSNIYEQKKKLISFVNTNRLSKADQVAKEIINSEMVFYYSVNF